MNARVYLDWNASAPLRSEAREAMCAALDAFGNPSSPHAEGRAARSAIETAREQVADLVGARPAEVVFTSGATEANAMLHAGHRWGALLVSAIEHPSAQPDAGMLTDPTTPIARIPVGHEGLSLVDHDLIHAFLDSAPPPAAVAGTRALTLVSHQLANGETGVIHDVARLARNVRGARPNAVIHADAAQAAGRIVVDMHTLGIDALTLSSHKLGGPQGMGALVVTDAVPLSPLLRGGGQERGRRAGTENVAAIVGFGAAAAAAARNLVRDRLRIRVLRDRLEARVVELTPTAVLIATDAPRLAGTSCISLPGRHSEMLVAALDLAGIAVSAGSACSSGKVTASPTLAAMGLCPAVQRGAIRVSLGWSTSEADVEAFLSAWTQIASAGKAAA